MARTPNRMRTTNGRKVTKIVNTFLARRPDMNEQRILHEAGFPDNFLANYRLRGNDNMLIDSAQKLHAAMTRLNKLPVGEPVVRRYHGS